MGSRSMTTVVTADTMALNAAMFGFAGHSVLTPHQALQNIWWTDERIEAKVTRDFITSKLRPNERAQLLRPMFMDSELTEDTYLDWVLSRAKRIFLILAECGCTDQIFGIAEDSWGDDDLPIALDEIPRLALSYKDDDSLNKRFYHNQFRFLLRPLDFQHNIDYAPNEVVPIEYVHKLAPAAALQKWSRFHLPKMPTLIYAKRRVVIGEKDEIDPQRKEKFLEDVHTMRSLEHEHIALVLATWTHKSTAYIMTSFVGEHTLRSFIDFRTPASIQKASKHERQNILLEWIHCLAHALTYLHRKRIAHSAICPTNLVVDQNNKIAFADLGFLETFQQDKKYEADELYNYGAPELFETVKTLDLDTLPQPVPSPSKGGFFSRRRKSGNSNSGSDTSSETASALSVGSGGTYLLKQLSLSQTTITQVTSHTSSQPSSPHPSSPGFPLSPTLTVHTDHRSSTSSGKPTAPSSSLSVDKLSRTKNDADRKASDVYSLACVFLDILTFMLKRKPSEFVKHRATKVKNSNGKGTRLDASFHHNQQRVQTWMEILENDLPSTQEQALFALPPLFRLINEMLNPEPHKRPSAPEVLDRVYDALSNVGGLQTLHCGSLSQRPGSVLSLTSTSVSGGSTGPSTVGSEPRIATFPEIMSLRPPAVPPKSPRRLVKPAAPPRPATPKRSDSRPLPALPQVPPLPVRTTSRMDVMHWGHRKVRSTDGDTIGVSV